MKIFWLWISYSVACILFSLFTHNGEAKSWLILGSMAGVTVAFIYKMNR